MNRDENYYEAIMLRNVIDHSLPVNAGGVTMGYCSEDGCKQPARGGGLCLHCAVDKLTTLLGHGYTIQAYVAKRRAYMVAAEDLNNSMEKL